MNEAPPCHRILKVFLFADLVSSTDLEARLLNALGFVLERNGELTEAEELYLEVLEIQGELLPENHQSNRTITNNLMSLAIEMTGQATPTP